MKTQFIQYLAVLK